MSLTVEAQSLNCWTIEEILDSLIPETLLAPCEEIQASLLEIRI